MLYFHKMKKQILEKFIEENSHLAEQGSKQWLEERRFIIGGSEIATVIGKNKYSTIQNLISQKIGITRFLGNTATRWGNLFESMTELIFQTLFLNGDSIYTTGSVPHKIIKSHCYSPDGLCIMKISDIIKIILLEFKAPLSSIPEGKIPIHYLPQIKTGLCTLDIAEQAIFMSNMFRKCNLSKLNFSPSYDTLFHRDGNKKIQLNQAIACGIILFSIPGQHIDNFLSALLREKKELEFDSSDEEDIIIKNEFAVSDEDYESLDEDEDENEEYDNKSLLQKLHKNVSLFLNTEINPNEYDLLDIGGLYPGEMDEWLKLYKPDDSGSSDNLNRGVSFLKAKYIKPNFNSDALIEDKNFFISKELEFIRKKPYVDSINKKYNFQKTIEKYKINCLKKGFIPVAVLPWKLMKSDVILLDKDKNYLDDHKNIINDVVDNIKYIIDNSSDLTERVNLFESLYPGSSIVQEYWDNKPLSSEEIKDFL